MRRKEIQLIITGIFLLLCFQGFSDDGIRFSIDSVDYHRIAFKKVRKLIDKQKEQGILEFDEIHTVCFNTDNPADFRTYMRTKLIRQNIQLVWQNVTKHSSVKQREGGIVMVGLLVSNNNSVSYGIQEARDIEVGQMMFFNLKLLRGLMNVGVAMQVTRIDNDHMTLEYCYLDHGLTKGTQQISLKATPEGFTEITHFTRYKCRSWFRNNVFYGIFHGQVVKEFLQQMKDQSEKLTVADISK